MSNTSIALLCSVVFMLGFWVGKMEAGREWEKIVGQYKDIIDEYRKSLIGSR